MNQGVSRPQQVESNADYNTLSHMKHMSNQNISINNHKFRFHTQATFQKNDDLNL
jgi:hypothetical protein